MQVDIALSLGLGLGDQDGSNIYATLAPVMVPLEDDETIADAFTAGSYAARVGTIVSADVTYYLNDEITTDDANLAAAVIVRADTLVTDSLGNTKTFSVSRAVGYSAPIAGTVPAQSWPEGQAGTLDLNGYITGYGLNFALIAGAWPTGVAMGGEGVVNITTDVVETASSEVTVRATNPEGEYDDLTFDVEVVVGVTITEDGSAVIVDGLAAPFDVSVNTGAYSGNTYTFTTENETAIASAPVALDGPIIAGTSTYTVTPALIAYLDSKHPVTRTYQWMRDAAPIVGETGLTYTTTGADTGTDTTCVETVVSDGDGAYTAAFTSNALSGTFSPTLLFASGEEGLWLDLTDADNLRKAANGTGAPPSNGDEADYVIDLSGRAHHMNSVGGTGGTWILDAGGIGCLVFDGIDDAYNLDSRFGMAGDPALTIFMGLQPVTGNATNVLWQIGANASGTMRGNCNDAAGWGWQHQNGSRTFTAPTMDTKQVVTFRRAASSPYSAQEILVDGAALTQTGISNGTNHPSDTTAIFRLGINTSSANPAKFRLYGMVILADVEADSGTEAAVRGYLNGLMGI